MAESMPEGVGQVMVLLQAAARAAGSRALAWELSRQAALAAHEGECDLEACGANAAAEQLERLRAGLAVAENAAARETAADADRSAAEFEAARLVVQGQVQGTPTFSDVVRRWKYLRTEEGESRAALEASAQDVRDLFLQRRNIM